MGSKKKRNAGSNRKRRSNSVDAVRKAQPDMSKYAGAVSNKSKRNYADLKLVRPDNLTEYASRGSTRKSSAETGKHDIPVGKTSSERSTQGSRQSTAKRKPSSSSPKSAVSQPRKPNSISGQKAAQSSEKSRSKAGAKSQSNKSGGSSKAKKPRDSAKNQRLAQREPVVEYTQDEYSKALNNSDFYSSVVEKYYLKHPEEQEKREKSGIPRKKKKSPAPSPAKSFQGKHKPSADSKSVAEMAVKSRGSADKKNHARVVKSGRAKGVVPTRAAHRRVRQRNRRKTAIFNSVIVLGTVIVLVAVYVAVFFNVKKIEVKGESPYSINQVISLCNFNKGDNILFVDTDGSEQKIMQKLPYIESCTIKRKLPATVVVNVTEAEVLGVAEIAANCWAAVSTKGKILDVVTNSAVVSSSDALVSLTYDPEAVSARAVAEKKGLPVLEGIDFKNSSTDGYIQGEAAEYLENFEQIYSAGHELGMKFTRLRYSDRGYEAEYDGRINIVLGDVSDKATLRSRLETANHIVRLSGDITEHESGEITYIKNETFYSPTYETEEEEEDKVKSDNSNPAQGNTSEPVASAQDNTVSSQPNDTSSDTLSSE